VRLSGTYINSDHMAALLEMVFFLVLGLFLALKPNTALPSNKGPVQGWAAWKRHLLDPRVMDRHIKRLLVLLLALLLASGLVLTQSRGGVWAGAATLATLYALEWSRRQGRAPWMAALFFVSSLVGYIWLVSGGVDLSRLGNPEGYEGRAAMYLGTLAMARDFLWTGVGLGALRDVFTLYQEPPLLAHYIDYPHSDWLQVLAELGLPGFALVLGGYLYFLHYLWSRWRRRNDQFAWGVGLGCLGALLSVGFHAAVEFPFHIPANSLVLSAVLALGVAAVHLHRHPWEHLSYPTRSWQPPAPRGFRAVLPLALLGVLCCVALPIWNHWSAEQVVPTQRDSTRRPASFSLTPESIKIAMVKNPGNPAYPALLAEELKRLWTNAADQDRLEELHREALNLYERAIQLAPSQWRTHHDLGWFLLLMEDRRQIQRGLRELQAAVHLFPHYGFSHLSYGAGMLYVGRNFPEALPPDWPQSCARELQLALQQDKNLTPQLTDLVSQYPEFFQGGIIVLDGTDGS
jgi:tetratricopeptide (TPR) repeat protein